MRAFKHMRLALTGLLPLLTIGACADGDPTQEADLLTESSAVVVDPGYIEDPPAPGVGVTACNGMHCCPDGYAMQGAHLALNMFKCRRVQRAFPANTCYVDGPGQTTFTVRNNMHACAFGYYMKGLNVGQNLLTCCLAPDGGIGSEFVDGDNEAPRQYTSSAWGVTAHTCPDHGSSLPPSVWLMSGIHAGNNYFNCGF